MNLDSKSLLMYAVTDRTWLGKRSLTADVQQSLIGGATMIQLREKNLPFDCFLSEAKKVKALCHEYAVPFIINDNVKVALACDADGIHVGQCDMDMLKVRALIGEDKILGVSTQTVEQAIFAEQNGADYLGVGAVFATSTKDNADYVPYDTLQAICKAVNIPVVAIGGISPQNVTQLTGSGLSGIAVVSAIFAEPNIEEATIKLLTLTQKMVVGRKNIKGAIFDFDGTILDSMYIWDTIGENYLKNRGKIPEPGLNQKFKTMTIRQAAQYYISEYSLTESVEEIVDGINSMIDHFYRDIFVPKEGVIELLAGLKQSGIKMGIATATDRYMVEAALERNGIGDYFSSIFTCSEVGCGKDQPDIYEKALLDLGTKKSETIVFEDAPHAIKTAKKAGFFVVGISDASFPHDQELIKNLVDIYVDSFTNTNWRGFLD